jgi:transcriptional regulator with XRE-family HTH domain
VYGFLIIYFLFLYGTMNEKNDIAPIDQFVIDYIIKLRSQKKLNQQDIAAILNVGRTFITNVESPKNRAKYNLAHIAKLADHFGISPQEFLPKEPIL